MSKQFTEDTIFRGVVYAKGADIPADFKPNKPDVGSRSVGQIVTAEEGGAPRASGSIAGADFTGNAAPAGTSGSGIRLEHAVGAGVDVAAHGGAVPNEKAGTAAEKIAEKTATNNLSEAKADAKDAGVKLSADASKSESHTVRQ